jgi:F-type H+-transporting ATPase subunit epsilon
MAITLEIITPEKRVYRDTVDTVVLPTRQGEIGILPGHIPLLTIIEPGELQVTKAGQLDALAVDKGFARILGDTVSVVTEAAINVEAIDLSAVREAQERAEKALREAREQKDFDPVEIERLESITRFAIAQQLAKGRKR